MTSLAQLSDDSRRTPSAPRNCCSRRGRKNLAVHLDGVGQDSVGAAHAIGHGRQRAIVQDKVGDQAADERIRRTTRGQGYVVSAGHQRELAVALVVEGQRIRASSGPSRGRSRPPSPPDSPRGPPGSERSRRWRIPSDGEQRLGHAMPSRSLRS